MVVSWACPSVVDRFQEFWYRSLGPTVLVVSGTVGWQVEVEGQGRVLLDTGRKQPPEETSRDGRARFGVQLVVRALLLQPREEKIV